MHRAGLILVILLGLGALGIAQFKVAPKIGQLESDLSAAQTARQQAENARRQAENAQQTAEEEAETLRGELTETTDRLNRATQFGAAQKARGDELDSQLTVVTEERNEARRSLAAWEALGVTIPAIQNMKSQLQAAREEIAVSLAENEVLTRRIDQYQYELSRFVGPKHKVEMAEGLQGSVVAVDPEWGFVVVNVGERHGAVQNGELLVSRSGKLVGKIQLSSVEEDRSVANVLPGWLQTDIQVGDHVLY